MINPVIHGFIADADNINMCGQRRTLDLLSFVNFLRTERHLNPSHSIVCSNYLNPMEQVVLEGFGFRCISARENCDDLVKAEIVRMVEAGVRILTLASGDGGYAPLLAQLKKAYGLKVHLVASRHCLSDKLRNAVGVAGISFIDRFFTRKTNNRCKLSNFALSRRPSGPTWSRVAA